MLESLIEFDKSLFLYLNDYHSQSMDSFMESISNRFIWVPFYLYLLYLLTSNFRSKSIYFIVSIVVLVTLCDQLSVHLFKNVFMRLRPCHEPSLENLVHIVNYHCGGQYGFVSSHATNVFGLAVFMGSVLNRLSKWWLPSLILWASIVSYSRIYLGVHYPFDIVAGALLGTILAKLLLFLLRIISDRYSLNLFRR